MVDDIIFQNKHGTSTMKSKQFSLDNLKVIKFHNESRQCSWQTIILSTPTGFPASHFKAHVFTAGLIVTINVIIVEC